MEHAQHETTETTQPAADEFRHEALFYDGDAGFVSRVAAFVREGVLAGEPALVLVTARKIGLLREALGAHADRVRFEDVDVVGRNPARIIPAWREFVDDHGGRPVRGVGEPIDATRSSDELVECHRHEELLNLEFADEPWRLLCPYDVAALSPDVVEVAQRTHPLVRLGAVPSASATYPGLAAIAQPFAAPLPEPPADALAVVFDDEGARTTRRLVSEVAHAAGVHPDRVDDLVLAICEIVTNSVRYGGGGGTLRLWTDGGRLVCDVTDGGVSSFAPLAGRHRPDSEAVAGRGLWIANQLCDLVQLRSYATGTSVRLHMRCDQPPGRATEPLAWT